MEKLNREIAGTVVAIVPICIHCRIADFVAGVVGKMAAMGIKVAVAGGLNRGPRLRTARELADNIELLDDDALAGYVMSEDRFIARITLGEGTRADDVGNISRRFGFVFFDDVVDLMAKSGISAACAILVGCHLHTVSADCIAEMAGHARRVVGCRQLVAAVLADADDGVASALKVCDVRRWGNVGDIDALCRRLLDFSESISASPTVADDSRLLREAREELEGLGGGPWETAYDIGMKHVSKAFPYAPSGTYERVSKYIADRIAGLGVIQDLMNDPEVSEIMVNGADRIYAERSGLIEATDLKFESEAELMSLIYRMASRVNRRIDESTPMVDARYDDGSRINAIIKPLSLSGPVLTIRRFVKKARSLADLAVLDMMPNEAAALLRRCVAAKVTMMISGGTGTGKTTLLGALASCISERERVITIEDSAELTVELPHLIRLEARPPNVEGAGEVTIRDLVKNALRMRPDRIIVGEVRGGEAIDMLQAMNTGHAGSLTTLHANSPRDAIQRLETMVMMSGVEMQLAAIRGQICRAIGIIVHLMRGESGRRLVSEIAEVSGIEGGVPCLKTLWRYERDAGVLRPTGFEPSMLEVKEV
jgi:pilus assembly protein CpaF